MDSKLKASKFVFRFNINNDLGLHYSALKEALESEFESIAKEISEEQILKDAEIALARPKSLIARPFYKEAYYCGAEEMALHIYVEIRNQIQGLNANSIVMTSESDKAKS